LSNSLLLTIVAALGFMGQGVAVAQPTATDKPTVTSIRVRLIAQNQSGQTGSAELLQEGPWPDVLVTLTMKGIRRGTSEPAEIRRGTCAKLDAKAAYTLTNATNGDTSSTLDEMQLPGLQGGKYAIVLRNAKNHSTVVACGNII
jgi:hypothetical protein